MQRDLSARPALSLNDQLRVDERAHLAQPRLAPREKSKKKRSAKEDDDQEQQQQQQESEQVIKLSQKESARILELAKDQLVNVEQGVDDDAFRKQKKMKALKRREDDDSSIEEGFDDEEAFDDEDEEEYEEEEDVFAEIDEADERAIALFSKQAAGEGATTGRKTLGEIILEKLREHEEQLAQGGGSAHGHGHSHSHEKPNQLNPQVIEVYTSVGQLMTRYRAGKVPKAFKILPALKDWEQILALTHPEKWSPQAMYQPATRLFASNMNPKMAQRFYSTILLPAIRDDIAENKTLNYHHYMSLKKAIYKPASFFKGILFPLCEEECTLREASIVGSVLAKVSVPVVHSGAALLKLSTMPYNGATSMFLKVLINKKYSLPYRVVDTLVNHFCSFTDEKRELPVLWHQALLVLVQRYRTVFSPEQKERFKLLLKKQPHKQITAEIRRELFSTSSSS